MPWLEENGLLPGRGAPGLPTGRGPGRPAPAPPAPPAPPRAAGVCGRAPGFGAPGLGAPGLGAAERRSPRSPLGAAFGAGLGAAGAADAAGATGGASAFLAGGFGPGLGAAGVDAAGASAGFSGAVSAAFLGAAGLGAAGLGPGLGAAFSSEDAEPPLPPAFRPGPISLRKRISAGSSTVELADLTNSPISLNFSRTNLLSTPNSLASSWTRVLATFLLLATDPNPGETVTTNGCRTRSSRSTHRVLMSFCSSSWSVDRRRRSWICDACRGSPPPVRWKARPGPVRPG